MDNCIVCGNPLKKNSKLFCSKECAGSHKTEQNINRLVAELTSGCNVPHLNLRSLKNAIIRIKTHKCEVCGNTEWMGQKIPLVLDHIDGRSSNNILKNLRLVCGNCDMQLPTYKSKNKNSDRKFRK